MELKEELITPELAKMYLAKNTLNRQVKMPVVIRYAEDMRNNRWKEKTGETIKIALDGTTLDGQHRLLAVIKSGIAITFTVAYNMDSNVFDVIDTGSVRTARDVFKISDINNKNNLPGVIGKYNLLINKKISRAQKNHNLTNAQLLDEYYTNILFWDEILKKTMSWYVAFGKVLAPSTIGGFYAYFYSIDNSSAANFMEQLCTGLDVRNNTIAVLRQKLIQDRLALRKMPTDMKDAFIIKTWNNFRLNTTAKILKYSPEVEPYPVAI